MLDWKRNKSDILLFCFRITAFTGKSRAKAWQNAVGSSRQKDGIHTIHQLCACCHFFCAGWMYSSPTINFVYPSLRAVRATLLIEFEIEAVWTVSPRALETWRYVAKAIRCAVRAGNPVALSKEAIHHMDQWKWSLCVMCLKNGESNKLIFNLRGDRM
jgi:hypothetical protein